MHTTLDLSTHLRWLSLLLCAALSPPFLGAQSPPRRHLIIVVDGLRPDYVTGNVMPNLTALGKRGVVFTRHHSVYPTVTRVNASSISTGAYPETHGLMGNSVFFPKVDPSRFLDTANRDHLMKISAVEGRLLTAPTLGESLQATGRRMLVVSSGSAGSALLNNHTVAGGAILHAEFVLPERMRDEMSAAGSPPASDAPPGSRDRYAVDMLLKVGIPRVDPAVTILWLGELDATAHDKGIGAAETVAVLRRVDNEIKRVEDGLKAVGLLGNYNIWVTSDHGFSTHTGGIELNAALSPFAGKLPDGSPSIVNGAGAIYVRGGSDTTVSAIVQTLQRTAGVGAIFTPSTQPGSLSGREPGTLSFEAARWTHDRSAQILYSPDWSDDPNAYGMRGIVRSGGIAGHGSSSPWDIHNTLIAAGPDLRRGLSVDTPSANADFAPTILRLLDLPTPASMQGRPLEEALVNGRALSANAVRPLTHTSTTADGRYSVTGTFSIVTIGAETYRYFDGTKVTRKLADALPYRK